MATGSGISIQIHGLGPLRAKLHGSRADGPVNRFLDRGAIFMQSRARAKATVDTGRMRNSIAVSTPRVRARHIGPNVHYGPYVEFGTRPHMPPKGALSGWASRHGTTDYAVRSAIARKGTKARPFLGPAAQETEGFVRQLIPILAGEIETVYARA
jgi:HK97 gp10 family phage protein